MNQNQFLKNIEVIQRKNKTEMKSRGNKQNTHTHIYTHNKMEDLNPDTYSSIKM